MLRTLSYVPSDSDRKQFLRTLRALDSKVGALALTGKPVPVSWLSPSAADALVQRWKNSRLKLQRDLAGTLIAVASAALYGHPGPEWDRIGYPGPLGGPPDEPRRLEPLPITEPTRLSCDVVIVGSGAGGGCTAAVLAAAGLDVIVLEKGPYRSERDFTHVESDSLREMALYGGTLTTTDLAMRVVGGSALGGGTVINWSTSWKTPRRVLEEWTDVSGIEAFASGEIEDSLDEVALRLGVNSDSSAAARRDQLLEEGLKKLGWHVGVMPRAVSGCTQDEHCGYCTLGCRIGAKQSSLRTYLEDAARDGARMIVGADVRRVLIRDEVARGVEARCNGHELRVEARAVVTAGGAIETPALLLRSGLGGQVGHNLRLHPATVPFGFFDDEVRMWEGTMQALYSETAPGPWSGQYGATLETGPIHPASWSTLIPWTSSSQHRELMGRYPYASHVVVLTRDTAGGRIKIDKRGAVRVHYRITPGDERRLADGVVSAGKILEAAGATEIHSTHKRGISFRTGAGDAHGKWADEIRRAGYAKGQASLVTVHQMGSCRMGTDPATSAVGPENESHEVKGLYVVDSSTFPTASGVNPMLSIYGIANRAGKKIAARLG